MADTPRHLIGYSRISTEGQRDGFGIKIQEDRIKEYAEKHGLPLLDIFRDEAVSGSLKDRPALLRLLNYAEEHKDMGLGLVFLRLDRLSRSLVVSEQLLADFQKRGLAVISIEEPDLLSNEPSRKLFRQFKAMMAEYEKEMITARMSAGRLKKVEAGKGYAGGRCAYGYRTLGSEYVAVPAELTTVRDIVGFRRKRQQGKRLSYHHIAQLLNKRGIAAPMGGKWFAASVQKVASNQFYKGFQRYGTVNFYRPELKIL